MFRVGDVVAVVSFQTVAAGKPQPRYKRHLCVSVVERWYFFLNTKGHWPDSFRITSAELPSLRRDRYIGCGTVQKVPDSHFRKYDHKIDGHLPNETLLRLADHVNEAEGLTDGEKEIIVNELLSAADAY